MKKTRLAEADDEVTGRGHKKVGLYLQTDMIEDIRAVGADLQRLGFSGTLSDVLRLVLSITKKQGNLDASKLISVAVELDHKH